MLNHVGTQNIETERLSLRKFRIEDAPAMFDNWAKNPENVEYLAWKAHESVSETCKILNDWTGKYKNPDCYRWCITLKDSDEPMGGIDVIEIIPKRSTCEIGYVLAKSHWNKGIMTEALRAVLDYLFTKVNFNRIQLRHSVGNEASGKVMTKCGMKLEGILRQYGLRNTGEHCDSVMYSILKSDWGN